MIYTFSSSALEMELIQVVREERLTYSPVVRGQEIGGEQKIICLE